MGKLTLDFSNIAEEYRNAFKHIKQFVERNTIQEYGFDNPPSVSVHDGKLMIGMLHSFSIRHLYDFFDSRFIYCSVSRFDMDGEWTYHAYNESWEEFGGGKDRKDAEAKMFMEAIAYYDRVLKERELNEQI